jgi:hypothetical protein
LTRTPFSGPNIHEKSMHVLDLILERGKFRSCLDEPIQLSTFEVGRFAHHECDNASFKL